MGRSLKNALAIVLQEKKRLVLLRFMLERIQIESETGAVWRKKLNFALQFTIL